MKMYRAMLMLLVYCNTIMSGEMLFNEQLVEHEDPQIYDAYIFSSLIDQQIEYIVDECEMKLYKILDSPIKRTTLFAHTLNNTSYLYQQLLENPGYCESKALYKAVNKLTFFYLLRKGLDAELDERMLQTINEEIKINGIEFESDDADLEELQSSCVCGKKFKSVYSLSIAYKHIDRDHFVGGKKCYACFFKSCPKKYKHRSQLIYHWKIHGLFRCCRSILSKSEFLKHRETCLNPLPKKCKFKKEQGKSVKCSKSKKTKKNKKKIVCISGMPVATVEGCREYIVCGCKKVFINNILNAFKHIKNNHVSKKHYLEEKKRYHCLMGDCKKKYERPSYVVHHWNEHGIHRCCGLLWTSHDFDEHKKICSKKLIKKRKYKKIK